MHSVVCGMSLSRSGSQKRGAQSPKCVASSYGFATVEDTTDAPQTARSTQSDGLNV
ncbi:hypothetical protein Tcan_02255 [Toxocara canis]|uniref:Uncharacterized protein n=1 Tax=Toxocara canis TaxID=6265 RepID=A0A0B2UPY5_TOXCA|nr:hypothetical protein Tcan_02255 [Toxocara canis]